MISADLLASNLLSPMVLAFVLGFVATLVKSDLKLPPGLYASLSIYLLFAIGLKGGVELSQSSFAMVWKPVVATLVLSVVTPSIAYFLCRRAGKLDRSNAAAMAAHYGSVSAVTFIAAISFAQAQSLTPEGFMPMMVALLEVPAILVALGLVLRKERSSAMGPLVHELLTGKAIILLIGGILIGWASGPERVQQVEPLFGDLFKGALTIFMLDMGLVAGAQATQLNRRSAGFLIAFGILVPLLHGALGVAFGTLAGLSVGGAGVMGAMAASASYIAAPAAVRAVLPEADPGLYLTGSIVVTFPFNLAIGIPLFLNMSMHMHSWF